MVDCWPNQTTNSYPSLQGGDICNLDLVQVHWLPLNKQGDDVKEWGVGEKLKLHGTCIVTFSHKAPKCQAGSEVDSQTPEWAQFCAIVGLETSGSPYYLEDDFQPGDDLLLPSVSFCNTEAYIGSSWLTRTLLILPTKSISFYSGLLCHYGGSH